MRQYRIRSCLAVVLSLRFAVSAHADDVDDLVRAEMQRQGIPGLSLVVLKDGLIVKAAGYGVADRAKGIAATPETVYKIGSVSKQFVAAGVMLLAQEGRLGVDDPVARYLPASPPAWNGITLRHLLTHTSGLIREPPGFLPFRIQTDADVIASAYASPLLFAPGESWAYSNLGYFVLGEVIRVASGQAWPEFMTEKIFKPSGMMATRTTTTDPVANRATGYTGRERLVEAPDWPAVRVSGAFISTVLDQAKWDAVLYTDALLGEASRRLMWSPVLLNDGSSYPYGFGWNLRPLDGRPAVSHDGGLPGFNAQLIRYVEERLTVMVAMNVDDVDDERIALGVAAIYLRGPKAAGGR